MNFFVGTAIVIGAAVAVFAFASGVSGASKKEKKPTYTRFIFPPDLGEPDTEYEYRFRDLDDGTTLFEYEFDQRHNEVIATGLFNPNKKTLKLESFESQTQDADALENRTEPCESLEDARVAFHNYLRGN